MSASKQTSLAQGAEIIAVPGPRAWEWTGILLVIVGFVLFNLATCNLYPNVWCDEISFSEPAINLVRNGSFTSFVWYHEPSNVFPTVNCPLYTMVLVPWLAAMGTTVLAVRSFNYVAMALAAFLLWVSLWRLSLVRIPWARLAVVVLAHLGYGMTVAYRCSRPDILAAVCLLLLLLSFAIERRGLRGVCILGLAAVSVWIGLQVALFVAFAGLGGWLVLRRIRFREMVVLSLGLAAGAGSLLLLLYWKGVLRYFLPHVVGLLGKRYAHSQHLSIPGAAHRVIKETIIGYVEDFTSLPLIIGLLLALAATWKHLSTSTRRVALYCLLLVFGVPLLFNLAAHYAFYYSYMKFGPTILGFFAVFSELTILKKPGFPVWLRGVLIGLICTAMLVGLPLRLAVTSICCHLIPRSEIQRVMDDHIHPGDVVLSDYAVFFEVKHATTVVYNFFSSSTLASSGIPGRDLTMEEKSAVSTMVVRPKYAKSLGTFLGGEWQPVTSPFGDTQDFRAFERLPVLGPKLVRYATGAQTDRYQVQIFTRRSRPPEPGY